MPIPSCVKSAHQTRHFLSAKNEIKTIIQASNTQQLSNERCVFTKWQVATILGTAPLHLIQTFVLQQLAALASLAQHRTLAIQSTLLAEHQKQNLYALEQQYYHGKNYIGSARNLHQWQESVCQPLYLQPDIPLSQLASNNYLKKAWVNHYDGKCKQIRFFYTHGLCNGASLRFIELFLKTKKKFNNPLVLIRAITKLFEKGVPEQAAFLDNYLNSPKLTIQSSQLIPSGTGQHLRCASKIGAYTLTFIKQKALQQPGPYKAQIKGHRVAYLNIHSSLSFIFDPDFGTIRLQGPNQTEKLAQFVQNYTYDFILVERLHKAL